jgi:RNA polymerase sigma-70 factor, ECF subfamily
VSQRVANRADAADISQEALLIACAKLGTFRGDNLNAWLFAIARNLIIDYYRSQGRFTFVAVTPAEGETEPALQIPHDAVLAECAFRQRLSSWLDGCSNSLDLEQQVAVLQSDVYDYHDKDSAAMLGMSVASFKLLLHSARARLKEIGSGGLRCATPAAATCRRRPRRGVTGSASTALSAPSSSPRCGANWSTA